MSLWNKEVAEPEAKPTSEVKPGEKSLAEQIAESLKPMVDTMGKVNDRLTAMEQSAVRRPERQEPVERVEPTSVLDDENVAFAQRLTPIMLRQLELEARIVRSDIKTEYTRSGYGDLWEQYEKDINGVLDGTPTVTGDGKAFRGDPQYIRNVVDMIFGREARKAGMQFGGKNKGFFLESGTGGDEHGESAPKNDGLSDDQRRVFNRMKVSTEDAKKVMTKLKFVNA